MPTTCWGAWPNCTIFSCYPPLPYPDMVTLPPGVRHPLIWDPKVVVAGTEAAGLCKAWLDLEDALGACPAQQQTAVIVEAAKRDVKQVAAAFVVGMLFKPDQAEALLGLAANANLTQFVFEAAKHIPGKHMHHWDVSARNRVCWLIDAGLRSRMSPAATTMLHNLLRWIGTPGEATSKRGLSLISAWLELMQFHEAWVRQMPEVAAHAAFTAAAVSSMLSRTLSRALAHQTLATPELKAVADELSSLLNRAAALVCLAWGAFAKVLHKLGRDGLFFMSSVCPRAASSSIAQDLPLCAARMLADRTSRRFVTERVSPALERKLGSVLSAAPADAERAWESVRSFLRLPLQPAPAALATPADVQAALRMHGDLAELHDVARWICAVAADSRHAPHARAFMLSQLLHAALQAGGCRARMHVMLAAALDWLAGTPKEEASHAALQPLAVVIADAMKADPEAACGLLADLANVPAAAARATFVPEAGMRAALRAAAEAAAAAGWLPCKPNEVPPGCAPDVQAAWAATFGTGSAPARSAPSVAATPASAAATAVSSGTAGSSASPAAATPTSPAVPSPATAAGAPSAQAPAPTTPAWMLSMANPARGSVMPSPLRSLYGAITPTPCVATYRGKVVDAIPTQAAEAFSSVGSIRASLDELARLCLSAAPTAAELPAVPTEHVVRAVALVHAGQADCRALIPAAAAGALAMLPSAAARGAILAGSRMAVLLAPAWVLAAATSAWCSPGVVAALVSGAAVPDVVPALERMPEPIQAAWIITAAFIRSSNACAHECTSISLHDMPDTAAQHAVAVLLARAMLRSLHASAIGMHLLAGGPGPLWFGQLAKSRGGGSARHGPSAGAMDDIDAETLAASGLPSPLLGSRGADVWHLADAQAEAAVGSLQADLFNWVPSSSLSMAAGPEHPMWSRGLQACVAAAE